MSNISIYKSPAGEREIMAMNDALLAQWPAPHDTLNVSTRHGRTFMIASGEATAPPLILLHGSCSNALSWIGDIPAYSPHFRVYAVDIPGEPGKSAQNRPAWNSPAFAEWLEDIVDALKIPRVSLLGISQGGWTALKFAVCRPQRVEKLVLLTPGGIARARTSFLLKAIFYTLRGKRGATALNRVIFGGQPVDEGVARYMSVIMTNFKPRMGNLPLFTDAELKRLTMPVKVIAGERDAILPSEKVVARLKKLVPNLDASLLPDAGHVLVGLSALTLPFLLNSRSKSG